VSEVLWPPDLAPSSQTWNILGNAASFVSPLNGATRTYGRPGVRMGCTITLPPINGQNRARMLALLAALKDRGNRIWVPDFSTTPRGSFPATDLVTNGDFGSGTTGFTGTRATLSVADRVLRVTNTKSAGASNFLLQQSINTFTQYAPYAIRAFVSGQSRASLSKVASDGVSSSNSLTTAGMLLMSFVPSTAAWGNITFVSADYLTGTETLAGDYVDLSFASATLCIQVDGSPNGLLRSDQFDNAAWTKTNATITANDAVAPDGTSTADALVEDATSGGHQVSQSMTVTSAAQDLCCSFRVKAGTRSWAAIGISDFTAHGKTVYVNLSTGALGSTVTDGSNVTNSRAFVVDEGNGWYRLHLVVRKSGSQTTMYALCAAATGDGGASYSGTPAAKALNLWRGAMAVSSVPFMPAQTTTAATTGSTQTGTTVNVKGLPASTADLLKVGEMVESGGQMNRTTAMLKSDAAGLGVLTCGNPFRTTTNDTPILPNTPMCKMLLAPDQIDIDTGPGRFSPITLELVEAID
jgi:hypothetical protein